MHVDRRGLLAAIGTVGGVALAGCVSDGEDPEGDSPQPGDPTEADDETETPTADPTPSLESAQFERTGGCDAPGTASVSFGDSTVDVEGCIRARDGCHYPDLMSADYGADTFRVIVEEVDESDPDEVCTQAIEYRAYSVAATFDDGVPATVEVIHVRDDERERVVTAEPE